MTLDELNVGQKGIIVKINGDKKMKQRLITMGFTAGETVKLEKKAPLGDPGDYVIKDYHISLRKNEAQMIQIKDLQEDR